MISGLQVDVKSAELKKILEERLVYHEEKWTILTREAEKLRASLKNVEEDMVVSKVSTGDVSQNLESKAREHRDKATYFKFMIDHVIQDDIYRLGQEDLVRLGITARLY